MILLMKSCYCVQRCGSDAVHHDVIQETRCQDVGSIYFLCIFGTCQSLAISYLDEFKQIQFEGTKQCTLSSQKVSSFNELIS